MKKFYSLILSLIAFNAMSQSIFYTESFEGGSSNLSFPNGTGRDFSDFFDTTNITDAPASLTFIYTGYDGNIFVAGEDIDGIPGFTSPEGIVYLDNIDISGKSNLELTAAFASGTDEDIDSLDYIFIEIKVDNGAWDTIGSFRADSSTYTSSSGPFNGQFAEDTDFNKYGNGTLLDGDFTDYTWAISGTGDSLDVRITMRIDAGNEEAAFDNVRIAGTSSGNYTLQILHASDLEGGVEAVDRAKFFAALVDTLEDQYANSVTLSAGDNFIPGPFFNAAADRSTFRDGGVFNYVYNTLYDETGYSSLREGNGRVDISIMNVIGFDASALGNHDFDAGEDALQTIIEEEFRSSAGISDDRWTGSQFPYLSSNLDFSASSLGSIYSDSLKENTEFVSGPAESTVNDGNISKIAAATWISRGGEKIGVVGVTTPRLATISSPGDVSIKGPTTNDMTALALEVQPWIDSLTMNEGIDKIILVTHLQQIQLEETLAGLLKDVDVIIAGGSDAILANSNDRLAAGDVALKPYPVFKENADGDTLAIVSTNGEYSYVGRLVIEFDANGVLIPSSIDSTVSGPYISDSTMVVSQWGTNDAFADAAGKGALVDSLTSAVRNIVTSKDGNTFGETEVYLNGERTSVRTEETNFGNLTADANLWVAKQFDADVMVSIKNGGGMRAAIGEVVETSPGVYEKLPPQDNPASGKQEGEVSQLDIENALRFNNGLTVLDLTASELVDNLEHGLSAWAVGETPGQFCQVGGVKLSFDPMLPGGSRIRSAIIVNENDSILDTLVRNGAVFGDTARIIKTVSLNFLAGPFGGDGYPFNTSADFANRVDLDTAAAITAGSATFATKGTEQDALAEYMLDKYSTEAFDIEDTDIEEDMRIQNLMFGSDRIFGVGVGFAEEKMSVNEDIGSVAIQVDYNNQTNDDQEIQFNVLAISTADGSDYTITSLTDTAKAITNGSFDLDLSIVNDVNTENDEILFIEIESDSISYFADGNKYMVLFIKDDENVGPTASEDLKLNLITSYDGLSNLATTEILDYDSTSQKLFVTDSENNRFMILDFSNPSNISIDDSVDVSSFGAINSLSVYEGVVATAVDAPGTMAAGTIAFYDTSGTLLSDVTVGVLPDMVTFTHDGQKVIVANEGEPNDNYDMDPEGSISIIDVSGGIANVTNNDVTNLTFTQYNADEASLKASGVRIFGPNATVAQDLEPEYVAVSEDNTKAYIAIQEANALAIVDLDGDSILSIVPLGWKDHSLAGNGLDSDRSSDEIHIAQAPFRGFYHPDAIATYEVSGVNYVVTANEGDSRDYDGYSEEERLDDLDLDKTIFPNADELFSAYGDIKVTSANGDIDNDGDYDAIYTYGARSFSIWNGSTGALVYDSGDDFEQIVSNHPEYFRIFNVTDDGSTIKNRSDDKGPEPEAVVIGEYNGKDYAFVGMERTGGVIVYDVSDPANPKFTDINIPRDTADGSGDQAPEGLIFISADAAPGNNPLLVAANEASNTITIWEVVDSIATSIEEVTVSKGKLIVYPNPSSNQIFITTENNNIQGIEMYDMTGKLIRNIQAPKQVQIIDVNDLQPNMYLLRVFTTEGIKTSKVIVN